jgi:hypothetical protein
MKRLLFTILALCVLCVGLQAQNTNTTNQKGVTSQGQLDTVRNTREHPTTQDEPIQSNFVDQFGKTGQRPGLSPYGQRLNAIIKVTSSSIVNNSVLATTASIAATVSDSGDYALPIIERGVCYADTANPTLLTATKVAASISGKGFGNFNVSLSGLQPNTAYHARVYAVSMYDTVYGADLTFTTLLAGTLSYATLVVNKLSVDAAFTNPLTKVGDGTVSYARSAGDNICTVNPNTGLVTLNGTAGTCTITATVTPGFYTYTTTTASYTLTVTEATPQQTPLTFEAKTAGAEVSFGNNTPWGVDPPTVEIEYSKNGGAWTSYNGPITLSNVGDKVSFRGDTAKYYPGNQFSCSGDCYIYGNIMSLVSSEGYATATTLTEDQAFAWLFRSNSSIYNHASKTLVLPATTLSAGCYFSMFYECTNLTKAPELPAGTLANNCYKQMFKNCSSLKTAPELPAEVLAEGCYGSMFWGCTRLTPAPALPATTLASSCYQSMFKGCTSLITAPALPATTVTGSCYASMFNGCSSLTTAPALLATTMAGSCYSYMFSGCTNLTAAPELPATTLANYCYESMFEGCTGITSSPLLPAATLYDFCYRFMFRNCSNLNSVTCLATNISASYCTTDWISGVAASGTFTAALTNWPTSVSGIPSGWTKILDLSKVTSNTTVSNGWTVTGTLGGNYTISVAAGATVTLSNATANITGYVNYAGLNCLGNATIILADGTTNTIGGPTYYPGIHIPDGYTLTIQGTGTLNASGGRGAGIGGGYSLACGNILIKSGIINASSNGYGAGIGGSQDASCGDIEIQGGIVTATGGSNGAGIGSGYGGSCGNIIIHGGTVTAYGGSWGAGIGSGYYNSSCGNIEIQGGTVTATGGSNGAGIGTGPGSDGGSTYDAKPTTCGTITISGGTVDATGGYKGAGIGTGLVGNCGNVTITSGVTQVKATKDSSAQHSIGRGNDGSHFTPVPFTVTIGNNVGAISTSPYTYQP